MTSSIPPTDIRSCFEEAARICPERPEAWRGLALLDLAEGNFKQADFHSLRAVECGAGDPESWVVRGVVCKKAGQKPSAEAAYRKAIELNPACGDAWFNLGNLAAEARNWADAFRWFKQCELHSPGRTDNWLNLGGALARQGRHQEAVEWFNEVLMREPENQLAKWNRGVSRLALGQMDEGWADYESRLQLPGLVKLGRQYQKPVWDGSPSNGKTLLVAAEQGFGDTLQFIRYARIATERGWRVIADVPQPLRNLLSQFQELERVVAWDEELPPHEVWIPILSLPRLSFAQLGFLGDPPCLSGLRRRDFKSRINLQVALVWSGNPEPDPARSMPVEALSRILSAEGIDFFNFQTGPAGQELMKFAPGIPWPAREWADFKQTADALQAMDLVITIDTSMAHLAGSLGMEVWTFLPFAADWRWHGEGEHSPWYPSMRLFRQTVPGDWTSVLERAKLVLQQKRQLHSGSSLCPSTGDNQINLPELFQEALRAQEGGNLRQAEESYLALLKIKPETPEAWINLATLLKQSDRINEALDAACRAVQFGPASASAWNTLGTIHQRMDDFEKAKADYAKALSLDPSCRDALLNTGIICRELGDLEEAVRIHRLGLAENPEDALHHWNLGFCLMLLGQAEAAWPELRWRWKLPGMRRKLNRFRMPLWDGGPVNGGKLLIHCEQGLGDSIQFARYLPLAREAAGQEIDVECPLQLAGMMRTIPGIRVLTNEDPVDHFERHAPLMDLPMILGLPRPSDSPDERWYKTEVQSQSPRTAKLRAGLVWAGNPTFANDRRRSLRLEQLRPLLNVAGVEWRSLQVGPAVQELGALSGEFEILDLGSRFGSFADTAAALQNLDLLISTDTSVPHLAGMLKVPTWLMLAKIPDWRWGLDGCDTPWYRSMRIFRQHQRGAWSGLIETMAGELKSSVAHSSTGLKFSPKTPMN